MIDKKAQMTIFVIMAVLIVVGIILFFAVRGGFGVSDVSAEFLPIYELYGGCIEQETRNALEILGTQGGRIDSGEYFPGSDYAPFSSHLNFLGIPVPYWYYVAGNNIIKEQVPSKTDMEGEIASYIKDNLRSCDFSSFYSQGFNINLPDVSDVSVDVDIGDRSVDVSVSSDLTSELEERTARKTKHKVQVASKVGEFYDLAREIYDNEIENSFLEEYAVDTLRLNAPVDGVTSSCVPEIWKTREVVSDLQAALSANIASIKFDGNYYELDQPEDKYFVVPVDVPDGISVNLLYSSSWPNKIEIVPGDNELLIAEPIGNQQGLGVLGFCYVPYHFVYDLSFPVLIQISDGVEIFQFPVSVVIDNNVPREAELLSLFEETESDFDICEFRESDVEVNVFDNNLVGVEASVEYVCFDRVCDLGDTNEQGTLDAKFPSCLNGKIIVKADGFADSKVLFSSNSESFADILIQREYDLEVDLELGGVIRNDVTAIVHFRSDSGDVKTIVFPDNEGVKLSEGDYTVEAFVYGDSDVTIPGTTRTECVEVSRGGLGGLFGGTRDECFVIEVPDIKVESALIGGGGLKTFFLESELRKGRVVISVDSLPEVRSLEQLQTNYELLDTLRLEVVFI